MIRRLGTLLFLLSCLASARLIRIELSDRSDVLKGASFGAAGPYERMIGKAFFSVDPKLAANQIISDVELAPVNDAGGVEFSADLYVLRPRDPAKGNGDVLFEVSNRGGKGMLAVFNRAKGSFDPRTNTEFGDNLLLEQGYTIVWMGWQWDVPRQNDLMRLYAPVATDHGKPITGLVRSEFIPDTRTTVMPLSDRNHVAYPVVEGRELTVRDTVTGPRQIVLKTEWSLRNNTEIVMERGFEPGRIYEFVYTSKDPVLVGLGPAAIRDLISFLRYGGGNKDTPLSDESRFIKQAYAFGVSQSGRFLRKFLYDGFNADEQGRKVFDGMMIHVAGAGLGSFNHRFAQPSRDGHPFMNVLYPTDIFPFTDLPETDPETGNKDGVLERARKANAVPKIFYTNSSYEYWGRDASLTHTSPDGKSDVQIPETTRIYFFAGGQHGPASFPPSENPNTQNLTNPNDYRWCLRALLADMDAWVKQDLKPPDSVYPRITDGTLVTASALTFPLVPGIHVPAYPKLAYPVDFGPEFRTRRIVTVEPPKVGTPFPVLVPQINNDGIDLGGVAMPEVAVPLATYTGWNLRAVSLGAPDQLFSMAGSFIPLPLNRAERESKRDPRLSVEERYASRAAYLEKIQQASAGLVAKRLLLERDVKSVVERSSVEWDTQYGKRLHARSGIKQAGAR